jgi:PAS domain-containing protein
MPDAGFSLVDGEALRLLHELQVHQIELELQNAELIQARDEMESALEKYTDLYDFAPVAYFTLDHVGIIRAANLTAATLFRIERSPLLGARLSLFVVNEHRQLFAEFLEKVFVSLRKESCEVMLTAKGESPLYVQIEAIILGAANRPKRRFLISMLNWKSELSTGLVSYRKRRNSMCMRKSSRQSAGCPLPSLMNSTTRYKEFFPFSRA